MLSLQACVDERLLELAHVFIDVGDHPEEAGLVVRETRVGVPILLRDEERRVRCVESEVRKEPLPQCAPLPHPLHGFGKEHVGAVAGVLLQLTVMAIEIIEVVVVPVIRRRGHVRRRKGQRLLEAPVLGSVRVVVPEMPFSEKGRAVAGTGEEIRHGWNSLAQHRPAAADVHRAIVKRIATAHELAPCRRAHRRDMKIGQPNALGSQLIEIRRPQNRIPIRREVAIPLVIRHHDDDVGWHRLLRPGALAVSSHGHGHDQGEGQDHKHSHGNHHNPPCTGDGSITQSRGPERAGDWTLSGVLARRHICAF